MPAAECKIGVLAVHGSVEEHAAALRDLGVEVVMVKLPEDLEGLAGLILPGGESTTIGKLMKIYGLDEAVRRRAVEGMAVYGTCAGAILMAREIVGKEQAPNLDLMDIQVERNAYGRQIDSFECELEFAGSEIPAVFIRAPKIVAVGPEVEVLAQYKDEVVAARSGKLLVSSFHPEMTGSRRVHQYFLDLCWGE